jgi:hypothetical protein
VDSETPFGDTPEHSDAERVAQPDRRFGRADVGAAGADRAKARS